MNKVQSFLLFLALFWRCVAFMMLPSAIGNPANKFGAILLGVVWWWANFMEANANAD